MKVLDHQSDNKPMILKNLPVPSDCSDVYTFISIILQVVQAPVGLVIHLVVMLLRL